MQSRRKFIQASTIGVVGFNLLQSSPGLSQVAANKKAQIGQKPKLRIALASDGHYGEPGTSYREDYNNIIKWVNEEHGNGVLDFAVFNGDLVHDQPELLPELKREYLDKLNCKYYAVPGNHDRVDTSMWHKIFGYEDNFILDKGDIGFVFANTSNIKGNIISANTNFLKTSLDHFINKNSVFVIMHIPPVRWLEEEKYFFDFPETVDLLKKYSNLKAIFNGHDHSLDTVRYTGSIPYFFDAHIGGSWGTSYKGYRILEVGSDDSIHTYLVNGSKTPILNRTELK